MIHVAARKAEASKPARWCRFLGCIVAWWVSGVGLQVPQSGILNASEARDIKESQEKADQLEALGEAQWIAAAEPYRTALRAWDQVAVEAPKLQDATSRQRALEARAGLACLLRDPGLLQRLRSSGLPATVEPPDLTVSPEAALDEAALERLTTFLSAARRRHDAGSPTGMRDGLLLLEAEALVWRIRGDMHLVRADELFRQALATIEPCEGPVGAACVARKARLHYKMRDFSGARALLESHQGGFESLPRDELTRHLRVEWALARFEGRRELELAALNRLQRLGEKAEEMSHPAARFSRILIAPPVDLAAAAKTFLEILVRCRLSVVDASLVSHLAAQAATELGEIALAEEVLSSRALPAGRSPWLAASVAANLGYLRGQLGDQEAALDSLRTARSLASRLSGTEVFQARIALNAARSLLAVGQVDRAREEAVPLLSAESLPEDLVLRARLLVGNVLYEQGRISPAALEDSRKAFESVRRDLEARGPDDALPDAEELKITTAINLANVLRRQAARLPEKEKQTLQKEAMSLQDRAMRAAHAAGLYRLAAVASANLGELHLETGSTASARDFVTWALARAEEQKLLETQWRCHWYLGRIAEAEGKRAEADVLYAKAESIIDSYRSRILDAELKTGFLTDKMAFYRDLVQRALSRGRPDLALSAVERSKARALLDSLGWRFLTLSIPGHTELYRRFVNLLSQAEKARRDPALSFQGVRTVKADYLELRKRLEQLQTRLESVAAEGSALRAIVDGDPLDARGVLAELPPDVTLVEYFSLGETLVALLAAGESVEAVSLPADPRKLSATVADYLLDQAGNESIARHLHAMLFAPLEKRIRTKRVIVVPHGALHQIPFESLRDGRGEYLVSRFEFVYLPSATMLRYIKRKRVGAGEAPRLLAVADPDTDYNGDGRPDMPPLPHAREEVTALSPQFPEKEILVGPEARKTVCLEKAPEFDVIHYACHGEFYPTRPWESALFLAPGAGDEEDADGRLKAYEVYGFDLRRSRLVALSGCETGRSRILPGDDTVSISTAFFHAGASSLLVSLWKVEDRATSALMRTFYRKWLQEGKDKARALQESKRELLAGGFAHPRQWAAFLLVGNP